MEWHKFFGSRGKKEKIFIPLRFIQLWGVLTTTGPKKAGEELNTFQTFPLVTGFAPRKVEVNNSLKESESCWASCLKRAACVEGRSPPDTWVSVKRNRQIWLANRKEKATSRRMMVKHVVFKNQGNKDRHIKIKIHEAVQNVTPIKYHVFLRTQKQNRSWGKIQTYKSKCTIKYLQISPTLI